MSVGPPNRLDSKWCIRYRRLILRFHSDILAPTKLSSTGVSAVLCTDHLDDPSIRYCLMVRGDLWKCIDERLGYRFYRSATYYEFGRDAYEAIVICSFMILMCNFLGSDLHDTIKGKTRQRMIFPMCCISVTPSSWV